MLLSWDHFLQIASNVGMTDESLQKATTLLESKVWKALLEGQCCIPRFTFLPLHCRNVDWEGALKRVLVGS